MLTTLQIFTIIFKDTPFDDIQWDTVGPCSTPDDEKYKLPRVIIEKNTEERDTYEEKEKKD